MSETTPTFSDQDDFHGTHSAEEGFLLWSSVPRVQFFISVALLREFFDCPTVFANSESQRCCRRNREHIESACRIAFTARPEQASSSENRVHLQSKDLRAVEND
ncbi:MAG: hypothetical protein ACLQJ0_16180 [Steroidobacteraceae bacterium]|jgi:hypothetical protein